MTVTSDLVTDQRVHRSCLSLTKAGYDVLLVGRELPNSLKLEERNYKTRRIRMWATKGPLFYSTYNLYLFFFLLFSKADAIYANDLDTLLPAFLVARLRGKKIIYDSHEYFTGVPELENRPRTRAVWKRIEQMILPSIRRMITVNDSIAGLYREEYNLQVAVVRNLPLRNMKKNFSVSRQELNLPEDKKIFLFQGAGINIDRGAEEAVDAISLLHDAALLFIGGGDVIKEIKEQVKAKNIADRVYFIPKQPLDKLADYTSLADFGLTLDKNSNLNYRFSLPNKLFDYIQAGLPVLASALPEVERIILDYGIGRITPSHEAHILAEKMNEMMTSPELALWKENLKLAAAELCWEREEEKFIAFIKNVLD